jgi:hypothetical protein
MKNGKKLFSEFANFSGAKFISLHYTSKTNEVAVHTINTNITVMNAKQKDFETLKNCDIDAIANLFLQKDIPVEVTKQAHAEMLESAEKNLSSNIEERTISSQAQTDAYENICNGIRLHKETGHLHIFGQAIQKKVLVSGEPKKPVKSAPKTIAKKMITKHLDLRASKYRTFILPEVKQAKVNGETIEIQ